MRKTNAVNDKTMRCSVCNKPLIIKGTARMETLVDHVCNPNREIPLSDKYVCSDVHCVTHGVVFWDYDGETFTEYDKYEFRRLSMLKYDIKSFFHHYKMQYGLIKLVNERLEWKNCEDNEFWRKFAIWWMPKVLRILQTKFITKLTKIQVK